MPDDPPDSRPPAPVEETSPGDAPPPPAPLPVTRNTDKADVGCLVFLGVALIGVFFIPAAMFLGGGVLIVPVLVCFLTALVTPYINPMERRSPAAKWWGRVITFCVLVGSLTVLWLWLLDYMFKQSTPAQDYGGTGGGRPVASGFCLPLPQPVA